MEGRIVFFAGNDYAIIYSCPGCHNSMSQTCASTDFNWRQKLNIVTDHSARIYESVHTMGVLAVGRNRPHQIHPLNLVSVNTTERRVRAAANTYREFKPLGDV